ncbi:MAG: RDD family protein [Deltaproteobacteria bacterium]|nr:MAG: RDD family protein [Deltaproteobacteria bacterium]
MARANRRQAQTKQLVKILPPEGVPLEFELASLSDRLTALVLDLTFIFLSLIALVLFLLFVLSAVLGISASGGGSLILSLLFLGLFAIRQGYFLFFELVWQGATPGKRITSIQVVSRDGGALTTSALISRNLLRDVEVFIPLGLLLAPQSLAQYPDWIGVPLFVWVIIMMLIPYLNRENLRMGDFLGGTMVIRVPKVKLREDKARQTNWGSKSDITFTPKQLAIYGEYELETLADILEQADQGKADDAKLAVIAQTIAKKIGYEGETPRRRPYIFLRTFYAAQRSALETRLLFGQRKASKHDDES